MAHGPPEASVPRQVETKTGERSTTRSPQQGKETGGESGVLGAHLQTPSGHQGAQGLVIQIETAADVPGGLGALGRLQIPAAYLEELKRTAGVKKGWELAAFIIVSYIQCISLNRL